jgi:hypothetical protein
MPRLERQLLVLPLIELEAHALDELWSARTGGLAEDLLATRKAQKRAVGIAARAACCRPFQARMAYHGTASASRSFREPLFAGLTPTDGLRRIISEGY